MQQKLKINDKKPTDLKIEKILQNWRNRIVYVFDQNFYISFN